MNESQVTVVGGRGDGTCVAHARHRGDRLRTSAQPVTVQGRLPVREEGRTGGRHMSAELPASSVGHGLSRGDGRVQTGEPGRAGGLVDVTHPARVRANT